MSIQEQINHDIKEAMKTKNADKLAALRAVKSAIILEATKKGDSMVPDDISLKLIAKLVKQRKDSAAIFIEQNRGDLADDEVSQVAYLEEYLPDQLEESEALKIIREVIAQVGASSSADLGRCMKLLIPKLNGKVDGSLISKLVMKELN